VARKKDAKSLFEVLSRDADKAAKGSKTLGVPGWFGPVKPPAPPPQAAAPSQPVAPPPPPVRRVWGEPVLSLAGGRVRISLNQVSAAVAVGGLLVLLALAFVIGRATARPAGTAPQMPGGVQPAGEDTTGRVVPVPGPGRQPPGPPLAGGATRQKGLCYLVIQSDAATRDDADDILRFLRDQRIATTVDRARDGKWTVRDLQGFADAKSQEADAYRARIEQLGREYERLARSQGRQRLYRFNGCFFNLEQ
jgi:hypothetical protein